MNRISIVAIAIAALACSLSCSAQEKGYWRAASTTAVSITGDIAIADNRTSINFAAFPSAQIRSLTPAELSAAFDADPGAPGNGHLYRLNVPAEKRFLHKNTLCGTEDTQWMATYVSGRTLLVDFFSGSNPPVLTFDALTNAPNLCGTFTYGR
jgi:hypothetical protein